MLLGISFAALVAMPVAALSDSHRGAISDWKLSAWSPAPAPAPSLAASPDSDHGRQFLKPISNSQGEQAGSSNISNAQKERVGGYTKMYKDVRCTNTATLFRGNCGGQQRGCKEICDADGKCFYAASWESGHCETYQSCPRQEPGGGQSIAIFHKEAEPDTSSDSVARSPPAGSLPANVALKLDAVLATSQAQDAARTAEAASSLRAEMAGKAARKANEASKAAADQSVRAMDEVIVAQKVVDNLTGDIDVSLP